MLPRIKINYLNGQLGTVGESPDGLFALICPAVAVSSTFALNKPYTIVNMNDLTGLGVTSDNNERLFKHVTDFYNEASNGTKLVVFGVANESTMTEILDKTSGCVKDLITQMNGALRGVFVGLENGAASSKAEGMDADVFTALPKAQALAEMVTEDQYAPLFIVLEGHDFTGISLKDLSTEKYNRVAVLVGDTTASSKNAALGTMAGRLASIPVQRNLGRVKDGPVYCPEMYIGAKKVESSNSTITDLYDKGYICPRKYVGKSGYFFTDDRMACEPTDDYAHITNRRIIDKAYRIAYITLLEMMLDELEVNEDGTLQVGVVKAWQQMVENAINTQMTAFGELSANTDGEGCICYIDERQNVLATSKVLVTLKVKPYGYARYIDVNLGFNVEQ